VCSWVGLLLLAKANTPHVHKEKLCLMTFPVLSCKISALKGIHVIFLPQAGKKDLPRDLPERASCCPGHRFRADPYTENCQGLVLLASKRTDVNFCAQRCAGS